MPLPHGMPDSATGAVPIPCAHNGRIPRTVNRATWYCLTTESFRRIYTRIKC